MRKLLFIYAKHALLALTVTSTQSIFAKDEIGINDYAKAHWSKTQSCVPFVRKYESVCGKTFSNDFTIEDSNTKKKYDLRANSDACEKLPPEDTPFVQKGQIITVSLQQAFISNFSEGINPFSNKKGEIAVVARIAEMDEASDFDFSQAGRDRARLIYYSEGVSPGQFLNFSQLPIYGPIEYNGKPLLLEFYILELDVKENTEISGLLTAAAGLGAIAYPPASPILKVLDTIGGGLLKSNKNDTEFKYHAALVSSSKLVPSLKAGVLEFGNYAFVKMPDPKKDENAVNHLWSKWTFNQKNARIYKDPDCSEPLATETYLTVQINRSNEIASLDRSNTLLNFQSKLLNEARSNIEAQTTMIAGLSSIVTKDKSYLDAKSLITYANGVRWKTGDINTRNAISPATKTALDTLIDDVAISLQTPTSASAKFQKSNAESLVEQLGRLVGYKSPLVPPAFNPTEIKNLLNNPALVP